MTVDAPFPNWEMKTRHRRPPDAEAFLDFDPVTPDSPDAPDDSWEWDQWDEPRKPKRWMHRERR